MTDLAHDIGSPRRSNLTTTAHGNTKWTDEREAVLRKMFSEGHSFGEIAAVFGIGRGAISGKCDRLGLKRHTSRFTTEQLAERAQCRRERDREYYHRQRESGAWHPKPRAMIHPDDDPNEDFDNDPSIGVALVDLKPDQCRFIAGDSHGPAPYCGQKVTTKSDGTPAEYCAHHYRRMYRHN